MRQNRRPPARSNESDTLVNVLLGGAVGFFGGLVVPFAPVAGGAIASYRNGGTSRDGLKIGTLVGFVTAIPSVLLIAGFFLLSMFSTPTGPGPATPEPAGVLGTGLPPTFLAFILVILAVGILMMVGMSALGGYLGIYFRDDF